jgi:hypothetical protein
MAVTFEDVTDPKGKLTRDLFPRDASPEAFASRIEAYLTEGAAQAAGATNVDAAIKAYVYWQGFDAVYLRLATSAATESISDDMASTYTANQLIAVKKLRDDFKASFEALVASQPSATPASSERSTHSAVVISW